MRTAWLLLVSIVSAALAVIGLAVGSAIRSGDWGDILGTLAVVAFIVGFVWCTILDERELQKEMDKLRKRYDL